MSETILFEAADQFSPVEPTRVPEPETPTPDSPPWGPWTAVGILLLSVALILFTPLLFLGPYLVSRGVGFEDQQKLQEFLFSDRIAIILQLAPVILAHALTLAAAWVVVTKFNTYSFRETLGWKMNGFRWWYSIPITFFFVALAGGLTYIFGDVENSFEQLLSRSREAVYLTALFATLTAPLVEEVVYRGLLYSSFQRRFGMLGAVGLVTLIFTAVHVPQYSVGSTPDFAPVTALLLLSLTLTLIRAKTGNLLPCIVLHTVFNGVGSVLLVAQSHLKIDSTAEDAIGTIFFLFR